MCPQIQRSQETRQTPSGPATLRSATPDDIHALAAIELRCFDGDRLSKRSFRNLIKAGPHALSVLEVQGQVTGYSLLLFRRGTSLARLYSIAVLPEWRGRGLARQLLLETEELARQRRSVFLRLEVKQGNNSAIALYEQLSYRQFDIVDDYYEDGGSAIRYEKRLSKTAEIRATQAPVYYAQTTEFSCGPASLMMAMHALRDDYALTRRDELRIWREATTIFMTSGHGGCSPHGLALSAVKRGFDAKLYINTADVPFRESVRDPEKRAVIELVHDDFVQQLKDCNTPIEINPLGAAQFRTVLERHDHLIALISTWALNRNKAPHWVYIRRSDDHFVYINDPDNSDASWPSDSDYRHVPIAIDDFVAMASFGRKRLRCLLAISEHGEDLLQP